MASQCQCFRFAEVWLCRFDLLRSYHLFHCKKLIYQTKLFPAITLYQSRAHHWNKFSEVGNQRNKRGWVIYVSRFSYWKLFWAVGGILPGLMICLPAMLANSPFLNLVISSPPNLVKDGQLICQINSNNLPSNLSSQLTLKGPVMISWPGCHLQFSHSPWTWSPTSIPTPTPTSTSISHQEKYDSFSDVGESWVWWRADFRGGYRLLKKVFWTFSYFFQIYNPLL